MELSVLKGELEALRKVVHDQGVWIERLLSGSIIVVDVQGAGYFRSVSEAVTASRPADTLVLRPGEFLECLVLTIPITIIGRQSGGPKEQREHPAGPSPTAVIICGNGDRPTLTIQAAVNITGVILQQGAFSKPCVLIEASQPTPNIADCTISADRGSAVVFSGGAGGRLLRCVVGDAPQHGVHVSIAAKPVLEDCEVRNCGQSNIYVEAEADPHVECCRVYGSGGNGVQFLPASSGHVVHSCIHDNVCANVDVARGACPVIEHCVIRGSKKTGACFGECSRGMLLENDIFGNGYSNVGILAGACPVIRRNLIHHAAQHGVAVKASAGGFVEGNHIYANALANLKLEAGAETAQRRNQDLHLRSALRAVPDALSTETQCEIHRSGRYLADDEARATQADHSPVKEEEPALAEAPTDVV